MKRTFPATCGASYLRLPEVLLPTAATPAVPCSICPICLAAVFVLVLNHMCKLCGWCVHQQHQGSALYMLQDARYASVLPCFQSCCSCNYHLALYSIVPYSRPQPVHKAQMISRHSSDHCLLQPINHRASCCCWHLFRGCSCFCSLQSTAAG
jgi:hypothetical protein